MFFSESIFAQKITFNKNIVPLIKQHCLRCHNSNGVGPFPFETYDEISSHGKLIVYVVITGNMPPWGIDTSQHLFRDERVLSSEDRNTIVSWVNSGMPLGGEKPEKLKYVLPAKDTRKPDLIVRFPRPVEIVADSKDLLMTYIKRLDLGGDKYISKIEVVPGNKKLVHHCRVDFDTTDIMWTKDVDKDGFILTPLIPDFRGGGPTYRFVCGYNPGLGPFDYPSYSGLKISGKVTILINAHYSATPITQYDQTEVHIFFCKKKPEREVFNYCHLITWNEAHSKNLFVPKDKVDCFKITSYPTPFDISLLAMQPHMHLLGKSMNIYAITPARDTIQLCHLLNYNFDEQENYYYKKFIKIPAGSVFEGEGCYDNTVNNSRNPHNPPQDVYFYKGMETKSEMIEFYMQYMYYQEGDENKNTLDEE